MTVYPGIRCHFISRVNKHVDFGFVGDEESCDGFLTNSVHWVKFKNSGHEALNWF